MPSGVSLSKSLDVLFRHLGLLTNEGNNRIDDWKVL